MAVFISFIVFQSATPAAATPGHNDNNELPDVYIGIGISLCIVVIFLMLILLLILIIIMSKKTFRRNIQEKHEVTSSIQQQYVIEV